MSKTTNIMIVGVGGQGSLLASKLLGNVIMNAGYDVKVSEVHGMSQRGGSVVTYVRYGEKVASPIIEKGEADIVLAFEQLEAARWIEYLKPDGKLIVNTQQIDPMPVVMGAAEYPEGVIDALKAAGADVEEIEALPMAVEAGTAKAVNVVLIGAMAKNMQSVSKEKWLDALKASVPSKFLELNLKAFEMGYNI
jgi:indolepyruvate ferredoxin oxidoreductase beta subunit